MKKMVSSGTLADRAAALTTLVQEDVVHNISGLENMVSMVKKKDRRESMAAIGMYCEVHLSLICTVAIWVYSFYLIAAISFTMYCS